MLKIRFLGHSSFILEDKLKVALDPYNVKNKETVDYIFVTHDHFDHCSPGDVGKLADPAKTVIVAPHNAAAKLKSYGKQVITVDPGKEYNPGLRFKTIPAYNKNKPYHPKAHNFVGYFIYLSETVYHSGDTDFIPEMKGLAPDIFLVCVGGTYTMDAKQAALAVAAVNPKRAIPMHYGSVVGSVNDARMLRELAGAKVEILDAE